MNIVNKIKNLNLSNDTKVTMSYEDTIDVFVHNDTAVETAISDTDVINVLSNLVTFHPKLNVFTEYGDGSDGVLNHLREEGLLEDYDRGEGTFCEFVEEVIAENFYDQDIIEYSVRAYDHKRGECTLSTEVMTTVGDLLTESCVALINWTVKVPTENGTLTLD